MNKVVLRSAFFGVPVLLLAASWVGCSAAETAADTPDAGYDAPITETAPPRDAADASKARDCKADQTGDGLWTHLECAGLYSDFATKTLSPDAKPFTPAIEFWSDGATKSRYLYLPPGTKIDITDFDDWKFPAGTRVWKEFKLGGKRIETRIFMKVGADWKHTVYRWNDAETDAVRTDIGEKIPSPDGGAPYEVPNTAQCLGCHGGRTDKLLGVEAVNMGLPNAKGVTLATLAAEGRFDRAPPATTISIPNDHGGTAAPALGWLHANCGQCHAKNGVSGTDLIWRLRTAELLPAATPTVQKLDAWTTSVGVPSTRIDPDTAAVYARIARGLPAKSLASILSGQRVAVGADPSSEEQMPPFVTRKVDVAGHKLLDDWITQIPPL